MTPMEQIGYLALWYVSFVDRELPARHDAFGSLHKHAWELAGTSETPHSDVGELGVLVMKWLNNGDGPSDDDIEVEVFDLARRLLPSIRA